MAQKVVRAGVFVEPADEVADGVDEILLPAGGGVEQHVRGELEEARRWWLAMPSSISNCTRSSAFARRGEHQAVGEREQIVRRDAEPHGGEILRLHAVVEHAVVVGVGLELRLDTAPAASRAGWPRRAPSPCWRPSRGGS